jgi:glycosyltransferase involved in cell wall biosynthesis
MLTIVLTYRNRALNIVKKCLDSLANQSDKSFNLILVDYGSDLNYAEEIKSITANYNFIKLISCPVSGQLWNKSRAINIALNVTNTPYFMVGDIDLIFHPNFIQLVKSKASNNIIYFKYGFLSREESIRDKKFEDYEVRFSGGEEVTGTTLFPTDKLKEVNGYDEFYHGWGAEDTDIHIRLRNLGLKVVFYSEQTLVKHQWHPKSYRSKFSSSPFHSSLERVNHKYINFTNDNKIIYSNTNIDWGLLPDTKDYYKLSDKPDLEINIVNDELAFNALLAHFKNIRNQVVKIEIINVSFSEKIIQQLKRILNKKYIKFKSMESINNILLETIIKEFRNLPYNYNFNRTKDVINLTIFFK